MSDLPLIAAARKGDVNKVRQLLADGANVNERAAPLSEKERKSAKWLINEGSVDFAAEAMGKSLDVTPLMVAAEEGHEQVIEALLTAGADANAQDSLRRTALMVAIRWKHERIALRLLAAGADPNAKDASGEPVLTQAIDAKLWRLANALLDAGAAAHPRGKKDVMPLTAAASECGAEAEAIILRLIKGGAKPNSSFLSHLVGRHSAVLVANTLRDFPQLAGEASPDELLKTAAKRRDPDVIKALIDAGIRPTNASETFSPLAEVIIGPARSVVDFYKPEHINDAREIACLELLIAAGADVNDAGWNPLHFAIYFCRSGLCRWLLDHGADPNFKERGQSLIAYAQSQLAEHEPNDRYSETEKVELRRRQNELSAIIAMLKEAGGTSLPPQPDEGNGASSTRQRQPSRLEQSLNIEGTPVAERRGVCADGFSKAEQMLIRAPLDKIADMLAKDRKIQRVERDVFARLRDIEPPTGDVIALVKLKGHSWAHVAGGRRTRGDSPMKAWSKALKAPVLYAGEQSTAGVVYYRLYDCGECVETFESDGVWFHGGIEIDPEVQDEADRMTGTTFTSLRREPEAVDWSAYESEYDFLDHFLREEDAYLTFMWAGQRGKGKPLEVSSYQEDEITPEAVERIDLVIYEPTPSQVLAATAPDPKNDALLQAIEAHDLDAVKAAIAAGAKVNALPPRHNSTYLAIAVRRALYKGDLSIVDQVLAAGANPNNGGAEPVLCEVWLWTTERVETMHLLKRLIDAGADVNSRQPAGKSLLITGGKTPLMLAAQFARLDCVKLLLKLGADPTLKDEAGYTAVDAATHWLREVKKDRLKDVPSFTDDTHEPIAKATVELLEAATEGALDLTALPSFEELAAETERLDEGRKRRV